MVRHLIALLCLAGLAAGTASVHGMKLYKVIQPDGTVVYQDKPPKKGSKAEIEVRDINPNANVVPIEQFPTDGEFTVPEGHAGSIEPGGPAGRTQVIPLPRDNFADTEDPAATPAPQAPERGP